MQNTREENQEQRKELDDIESALIAARNCVRSARLG